MRFRTIWTLSGMAFSERLRRTRDWAALTIAVRLPRRIRYWDAMAQLARVSTKLPSREVGGITMDEIMDNLEAPRVMR